MEYAPTGFGDPFSAALDYLLRAIPPADLWRIVLVTLSILATVQAFKYITQSRTDGDGVGAGILRALGVAAGPVYAWVFWPVSEVAPLIAIGLIGWVLAHLLAVYGMRWLEARTPRLYRAVEGLPDRRGPEGPPPRGNRRKR